jgi:cation diffusion facilitator family transporter
MPKKLSDTRVVATSLAVSVSDVALNGLVGLLTGSTVMFAQALQGLSDLTTGGLLLAGVRRSKKVADTRYQFGYGREVFFWVLMAGLLMFLITGGLSFFLGYRQFTDPGVIENTYLAVGMLVFGFASNGYALSLSIRRLRQVRPELNWLLRLRHSSIVETKSTLLIDLMGTLAALLGLIAILAFVITGDARFDGAGSMVIGLAMMVASAYLIHDVRALIVGRSVDEGLARTIIATARSVQGVNDVLDLRTMYLGSGRVLIIIEAHIEDDFDTDQIERIVDEIKRRVHSEIPEAHHVQVEIETPDSELNQA